MENLSAPPLSASSRDFPGTAKTLRISLKNGLKGFRHGNIILRQGRLRGRSVYGGGTVEMAGNLLRQSGDVIGITPAAA